MEQILDHGGLEVLTFDECMALLASQPVGRIAYMEAGAPVILPVNHRLEGRQIVFRTAHGSKLAAALMNRPVAFEIDGYDAEKRTGWSVLVRGRIEVLFDPAESAVVDGERPEPWADSADRDWWIRVLPDDVTGRRIPEFEEV